MVTLEDLSLEDLHKKGLYYYDVYNTFIDYFGDGRVDLQTNSTESLKDMEISDSVNIIVHFPKVRVTNENDRFVDIYDLWAKVPVYGNGKLQNAFMLNRSTFQLEQALCQYVHSHVNPHSGFLNWSVPCTGTGPIVMTMNTLVDSYNLDIWQLFCRELDEYTKVESLTGGPWIRLEEIGRRGHICDLHDLDTYKYHNTWEDCVDSETYIYNGIKHYDLVKALLEDDRLKFNFHNGQYGIAISCNDFALLVTKKLYELGGQEVFRRISSYNTFKCLYYQGRFFSTDSSNSIAGLQTRVGGRVLTFKGHTIKFRIIGDLNQNLPMNEITIWKPQNLSTIYKSIIKTLNCLYGKQKSNKRLCII